LSYTVYKNITFKCNMNEYIKLAKDFTVLERILSIFSTQVFDKIDRTIKIKIMISNTGLWSGSSDTSGLPRKIVNFTKNVGTQMVSTFFKASRNHFLKLFSLIFGYSLIDPLIFWMQRFFPSQNCVIYLKFVKFCNHLIFNHEICRAYLKYWVWYQ